MSSRGSCRCRRANGDYHLTVKRCFDRADFDTRIVHPFATKHYRAPSDGGNKTDDSDLDAIFRATLAGYGLVEQELAEPYISLDLLARHRRDLVRKRSIVCCQIREHLELVLPGYASLFDDLWRSNIALCLAQWVGSLQKFQQLGVEGLCQLLREHEQRFIRRVVERVAAWAHSAAAPHPESSLHQRIWLELEEDRKHKCQQIKELEREDLQDPSSSHQTKDLTTPPANHGENPSRSLALCRITHV